jgi:hypothetical protein
VTGEELESGEVHGPYTDHQADKGGHHFKKIYKNNFKTQVESEIYGTFHAFFVP